jgi:hypothetical protein
LKQLEFYFGLHQVQETQKDLFFPFEDDWTCSAMVGDLCGCTEDRREAHGGEMGGIQGIIEVTILSHGLQRGTNHEVVVPSVRTGTRSEKIHFRV